MTQSLFYYAGQKYYLLSIYTNVIKLLEDLS